MLVYLSEIVQTKEVATFVEHVVIPLSSLNKLNDCCRCIFITARNVQNLISQLKTFQKLHKYCKKNFYALIRLFF